MKNQTELVRVEPSLPARQDAAFPMVNIEGLLSKAIDAQSAVEVLERLQVMRREMRAEQAKEAYDKALADFQAECPIIQKKKVGAKNAYRYAPLDDIISQVRELIRKHGFSFSITSEIEPGWVKAQCKITHSMGHSSVSEFKVPVDNKNPMMTDPQRYGGAMTFSKRYAFANGFGILTADEDVDAGDKPKGQGPQAKAPDDEVKQLATELWSLLKPVRGPKHDWEAANQWLYANDILDPAVESPMKAPHLSAEVLRAVIAKAKGKL